MLSGAEWIKMAQDTVNSLAFVNTIMKLLVP